MSASPVHVTESSAAAAFDSAIENTDLFTPYAEVCGTLIQPRPGQIDKSVRIDRLLIPKQRLLDMGWTHGIVGVELKRSDIKLGPPIAQAMDYSRSVWTIPGSGFQVMLSWVFLFPVDSQIGPIASVMAQHRIGTASANQWSLLEFKTAGANILRASSDGTVRLGITAAGTKAGSR